VQSVCMCLTKGDAQVAWHHTEVDQLCRHPDHPEGLAVVPQLRPVLLKDVCGGAALHKALHAVKHREVEEGMAAGHRQAGSMNFNAVNGRNTSTKQSRGCFTDWFSQYVPALCAVLAAAHVAAVDMYHPFPMLARPASHSRQDSSTAACTDSSSSRYCLDGTNNCPCSFYSCDWV
jgi:hypothetical protein